MKEKTEPEQENELLQSVKNEIAIQEYGTIWNLLSYPSQAHEVDKVAIRYNELNNQKQ